jgi:hypothetical protein
MAHTGNRIGLALFLLSTACLQGLLGRDAAPSSLVPFVDYVWLDSVSGPPDTIYTDTIFDVRGKAMLHASQNAPGTIVRFFSRRYGSGSTWYYDTFDLAAGESLPIVLRVGLLPESARYILRESLVDDTPTESSFVTWQFWVLPGHSGINEGGRQPATGARPLPTVIRRIPAGAVAFDAMGRQALNPKPGVYFVRAAPATLPRKVLLVE